MATILKPDSADQVTEALAWAAAEESPFEIVSRGSKRGLGRPLQTANTLDLSGLSGITLYEPEELVLSARAGTALAEIEATLAEKNQMLAFEPADWGPLLGGAANAGSIAGTLAFLCIGLGFLGSPQVFVRFMALRDESEISRGATVAITGPVGIGRGFRAEHPRDPQLVRRTEGTGAGAIALADRAFQLQNLLEKFVTRL